MARLELGHELVDVELAFLDCDGVVFDVNSAKTRAFADALHGYPEDALARFIAYHQREGGTSRYAKLRHFFEVIHPVQDAEAAVRGALARYGELSRAAYRNIRPDRRALDAIRRLGGARGVYVVSGSDQAELRDVFAEHGLRESVADVLGSPTPKGEHLERVLCERRVSRDAAVMIGDGKADFEAARRLGIWFIYLREMSEWPNARDVLRGHPRTVVAEQWDDILGWCHEVG